MSQNPQSAGLTAEKIVYDFKNTGIKAEEIKGTLNRIFIGFFASTHCYMLEDEEREEISFHLNVVLKLLNNIEKCKI